MKKIFLLLYICILPSIVLAENLDAVSLLSQSIENWVAHDYITDADAIYTSSIGREGTSIINYKTSPNSTYCFSFAEHKDRTPGWAEQPQAIRFATKGASYLEISDSYDFASVRKVTATGDTTRVYNLLPNKVYWYRLCSASNKALSRGVLKTQGRLRQVQTEQVLNFRDIGGLRCVGGGHLAYGKIFRGACLDGSTRLAGQQTPIGTTDQNIMKNDLGIRYHLDLNTNAGSSVIGSGVTYKHVGISHYMYVMKNLSWDSKNKVVKTSDQYTYLNTCLTAIANSLEDGKPLFTHCQWGADRTGTLCAFVEAICGVQEKDIVVDWELTSLMSVFYHKFIDEADASYYEKVDGTYKNVGANLRSVFNYLHDNYGGKSGKTFYEQVKSFLQTKVFSSRSDKGASIMNKIKNNLVVPDTRTGVIIKDWSKEKGTRTYTVTEGETTTFSPTDCKMVNASTGAMEDREAICCTDYIDCSGLSTIWMNVVSKNNAAFYDASKKFISGAVDSSVSSTYGANAIIMKDGVVSIPSNAKYVRFNMKKYCGWTAVMY